VQTFRIDSATPKEIDIIFDEGGPRAETIKWIYELNGDTLKLGGFQGPGQPRPKSFNDANCQWMVFKRVLPPEAREGKVQ
jgi:uncharacterized protein (TIGR03067 family)